MLRKLLCCAKIEDSGSLVAVKEVEAVKQVKSSEKPLVKEQEQPQQKKPAQKGKKGGRPSSNPPIPPVAQVTPPKFAELYEVGKKIGKGNFSTVHAGKEKTGLKREVAIKKMDKRKLKKTDRNQVKSEVQILKGLVHPHIIQLHDMYEDDNYFYIVTELAHGGELYEQIIKKEFYSESDAADVIRRIAEGLKYCHDRGVVHRDLKPENILLAKPEDDTTVKIVDFGFAKEVNPEGERGLRTTCGTPGYVAPEIISGKPYGKEVDVWSLGVILYILLSGYPPFYEQNQQELFKKIRAGRFQFDPEAWDDISDDAKDLVSKMLVTKPHKRLTIDQVLSHRWVTNASNTADITPALVYLKKYQIRRKLKEGMFAVGFIEFVKGLSDETAHLKKLSSQEVLSEDDAAIKLQTIWRGQIAQRKLQERRDEHINQVAQTHQNLIERKERHSAKRTNNY